MSSALWDHVRACLGWGRLGAPQGPRAGRWASLGAGRYSGGHPSSFNLLLASSEFGAAAPKKGNGWEMLLAFVWVCAPQTVILWLFGTQYLI